MGHFFAIRPPREQGARMQSVIGKSQRIDGVFYDDAHLIVIFSAWQSGAVGREPDLDQQDRVVRKGRDLQGHPPIMTAHGAPLPHFSSCS